MPHENLTYDDLLRIVELVKATEQFSEFRLKVGEIEIELRRRGVSDAPEASPRSTAPTPSACHPLDISSEGAARPPVPADPSVTSPERPTWPWGSIVIRSPMVGTFYRAPGPGAQPFVDVGHAVDTETLVCIIEVMKLMSSIPAGFRGSVTHILVDDVAPVEAGQPLPVLEPQVATR